MTAERAGAAARSALPAGVEALRRAPPAARAALLVLLAYAAVALLAPLLAPFPPDEVVGRPYESWGGAFALGTDQLGRDLLSRLIHGARATVGTALLTTLLAFAAGGTLGLLAAAAAGWADQVLARAADVVMAVPQLVLALLLLSILGPSTANLVLVIAALDAAPVFRVTRALAMDVVALDFVEAARLQGERLPWIMGREVLPNVLPPLLAELGLRFAFVVLTVSALSFLGLGVQPPTADWGSMVRENATLVAYGDATPLLPAAAIAVLAVAVNFTVDWFLHEASGLDDGR